MASSHTLPTQLKAPPLSLLLTEPIRGLRDYLATRRAAAVPRLGDGHPVVVFPGLAAGAFATARLRRFLGQSGFSAHDWGQGCNTGPSGDFDAWLDGLVRQVTQLQATTGRRASLVGWSLGGVYAREIAKRCPQAVRQVITLGTPFAALANANHAGPLYRLVNRDTAQLTPELQARLRERPPVPTTAIYSLADGVVAWLGCVEQPSALSESVQVAASHLGMVSHPEVLRIVAERLAQPEGQWRAYAATERQPVSRRSS